MPESPKAVCIVAFVAALLLTQTVAADTIYDTSSDSSNFANTGLGARNFGDVLGGDSLSNDVAGMTFVGNGELLSSVEVIYQYADDSGINNGDIAGLDWRVALYLDPNLFTVQGLFGAPNSGANAPDFVLDVAETLKC